MVPDGRRAKIVALLLLVVLSARISAWACECENPTFEKSLEESSLIFSGTVSKIDQTGTRLVVHFQPVQIWKGAVVEKILLGTPLNTAQCGYPFILGNRYVVFAGDDQKMPFVSLCSRTRKEEDAAEDLTRLVEFHNSQRLNRAKPKSLTIFYAVVMGISKRGNEYLALIKGADGTVYTMKSGDALYDGKIAKIDRNSVTFVRKSGSRVRKKLHEVPEP